jgi:diacylglycerol kinase family enzyme
MVFVINPTAGQGRFSDALCREIERFYQDRPFQIHITADPDDAAAFVCNYPRGDAVCFVSCGGDGTLADVATGLMRRKPGAETQDCLTCLPFGSGNDFIRYFKSSTGPWTPVGLLDLCPMPVDVYRCNDRYGVNICNFGFDGRVVADMMRIKKWKGVSGTLAYNLAVLSSLFRPLGQRYTIQVDGTALPTETLLLGVAANGMHYGGSFTPAPMAKVDDGRLEFVFIRKMSRLVISQFIGAYKRGSHLTEPRMTPYIIQKSGQNVEIASDKPITYTIDGNVAVADKLAIEIIPAALTFMLPA